MPKFNRRSILRKSLQIFSKSGQVIVLLKRAVHNTPAAVPVDLFASELDPDTYNEFIKVYVIGQFDQFVEETMSQPGLQKQVRGFLTVPMLYKDILAATDYIDPYNDGSLFIKVGSLNMDAENLFVTQTISGVYFPNPSQITEAGF